MWNNNPQSSDTSTDLLRKILIALNNLNLNLNKNMPIDNPSVTTLTPVVPATAVDRSGTVTANNTSQQIAAANPARQFFWFQNVSGSDIWINFGAVANKNQPSILVATKGSVTLEGPVVLTDAVNVIGNAGQAFTAKEA